MEEGSSNPMMGFLAYTNAPGLKVQDQGTAPATLPLVPGQALGQAEFYYKECMRNQAASIGGLAFDGCREFMPPHNMDPNSFLCVACGCHRNFHRPQVVDVSVGPAGAFHRHIPPSSPSTPVTSSSPQRPTSSRLIHKKKKHTPAPAGRDSGSGGKKRHRSKFKRDQKMKMLDFSNKVGWKIGKTDPEVIKEFCKEVGVDKKVLRIWMNNNKHTLGNI